MQHTLSNFPVGRQRIFQFLPRRNEINKWKKVFRFKRKTTICQRAQCQPFSKLFHFFSCKAKRQSLFHNSLFSISILSCAIFMFLFAQHSKSIDGVTGTAPWRKILQLSLRFAWLGLDIIYDFSLAQKSVAKRWFFKIGLDPGK